MSRLDRILAQQDDALERLERDALERTLLIYEAARAELQERLYAMEEDGSAEVQVFTAQHLRVMLAQSEAAIQKLEDRMRRAFEEAARAASERALQNLLAVFSAFEPLAGGAGVRVEQRALGRLQEEGGLLLHRHSARRYSATVIDDIQRELSVGVVAGRSVREVRNRLLSREGSVLAAHRGRADLIARMEFNSAYNRAHQAAAEEAVEELDRPGEFDPDDPSVKMASESRDLRNHPISRVLHGMTVAVHEPFRVPAAEVLAANAVLNAERAARKLGKRSVSGIVWPLEGGFYVGMTHPAHYNDRGRQVLTRKSWAEERKARVGPRPSTQGERTGGGPLRRSMAPDPNREPRGTPPEVPKHAGPRRDGILGEVEAARYLSKRGFDVEYLTPDAAAGKTPDLVIEGRRVEVKSPTSTRPSKVRQRISEGADQAPIVVLNLRQTQVDLTAVRRELLQHPVGKLEALYILVDGDMHHWIP